MLVLSYFLQFAGTANETTPAEMIVLLAPCRSK
jgi:hypothetical protein